MKGELLKLSGSLMLVHGVDVPELSGEVTTMLGWCDSVLKKHAESKRVSGAPGLKGAFSLAAKIPRMPRSFSAGGVESKDYYAPRPYCAA